MQLVEYKDPSSLAEFLGFVNSHTEPYLVNVCGAEIIVMPPHVMSPAYDYASHFFGEVITEIGVQGKSVLEIGSGCGVLSVLAWKANAAEVDAMDINPHAVENTEANFVKHCVDGCVMQSDVFGAFAGHDPRPLYDVIVFEAPYRNKPPNTPFEQAITDTGNQAAKRFLAEAPNYLAQGGTVLLGYSPTIGKLYNELMLTAAKAGLHPIRLHERVHNGNTWRVTELVIG